MPPILFSNHESSHAVFSNSAQVKIHRFIINGQNMPSDCLERLYEMLKGLEGSPTNRTLTQQAKAFYENSDFKGSDLNKRARQIFPDSLVTSDCKDANGLSIAMNIYDQPLDIRKPIEMLPAELVNGKLVAQPNPNPSYDTVKDALMRDLLRIKFSQNPVLIRLLLDTKNSELIEDISKRQHKDFYWGGVLQGDKITGNNKLGKLLKALRVEFLDSLKPQSSIPIYTSLSKEVSCRLGLEFDSYEYTLPVLCINGKSLKSLAESREIREFLADPTMSQFQHVQSSLKMLVATMGQKTIAQLDRGQFVPIFLTPSQLNDDAKRFYEPDFCYYSSDNRQIKVVSPKGVVWLASTDASVFQYIDYVSPSGVSLSQPDLVVMSPAYSKSIQIAHDKKIYVSQRAELRDGKLESVIGLQGESILICRNCSMYNVGEEGLYEYIELPSPITFYQIGQSVDVFTKPLTAIELELAKRKFRLAMDAICTNGKGKNVYVNTIKAQGDLADVIYGQMADLQLQVINEESYLHLNITFVIPNISNVSDKNNPYKIYLDRVNNKPSSLKSSGVSARMADNNIFPLSNAYDGCKSSSSEMKQYEKYECPEILNYLASRSKLQVKAAIHQGQTNKVLRLYCQGKKHAEFIRNLICRLLALTEEKGPIDSAAINSENKEVLKAYDIEDSLYTYRTGVLLEETKGSLLFKTRQNKLYLSQLTRAIAFDEKISDWKVSLTPEKKEEFLMLYSELLKLEREGSDNEIKAVKSLFEELLDNKEIRSAKDFKEYYDAASRRAAKDSHCPYREILAHPVVESKLSRITKDLDQVPQMVSVLQAGNRRHHRHKH